MTEPRYTFGQETAADAKAKADEKKAADAKAKADAEAAAKAEKDEKKEEKPKRRSLPEQLEDVIEKLEKHEERFSQADQLAFQGLGKRLSRTLGAYREPKAE